MKTYPSIPKIPVRKSTSVDQPVYVFDKLDGSNIRVEWSKKKGFHKFGTRKRLLDPNDEMLGKACRLVDENLAEVFIKNQWQDITAYFEYHGENSFAGRHNPNDNHRLTLIDVNVYKRGFVSPKEFYKQFRGFDVSELLYHGIVDQLFIDVVENGELEGMTFEGVVCKYSHKKVHKMFKLKNRAWLQRLREFCGDDQEMFNRLS